LIIILTQLVSNIFSTYFYDTKVVQSLYPTSHKVNVKPYGFIFLFQNILNILFCVHIKIVSFSNWTLGKVFFCLFYLANTLAPHSQMISMHHTIPKVLVCNLFWSCSRKKSMMPMHCYSLIIRMIINFDKFQSISWNCFPH
jgi:hypothetical protein